MTETPLERMRAQRNTLDKQIREAEQEASLEHNRRMDELLDAVERFGDQHDGWTVKSRDRKNSAILDVETPDRSVTVELYYDHRPDYPLGTTVVSVTDHSTGARADFNSTPSAAALSGLILGSLTAEETTS